MSNSSFCTEPFQKLVLDASSAINIITCGHSRALIESLPHELVITPNAIQEIHNGKLYGHNESDELTRLLDEMIIREVNLSSQATAVYHGLIQGSVLKSLDDGEAATIGYAIENSCLALIDEKKAINICRDIYPNLEILTTTEVLLHNSTLTAIGEIGQAEAIFNALTIGRMRVPNHLLQSVISMIGADRAGLCHSLPRPARQSTTS